MYLSRLLNIYKLLKNKSFFLFGPRATGKSSLIREECSDSVFSINLLRSDLYLRLRAHPYELESLIKAAPFHEIVVIDEVQRIPLLLNEVHRLIEEQGMRFLLTGSSARSLRKGHVNLLAGRAREAHLFPLTACEIPDFNLDRYLRFGGLPAVYLSHEPEEELRAYVDTYLKEEIQAESMIRNIPAFSRFLEVAALSSGQLIKFSAIASDTGIPASTVREYYKILEETFIGFLLLPWTKTLKRKSIQTAKFYLFDTGVKNALSRIEHIEPHSDLYGQSFEQFLAMELRAYLSYRRLNQTLHFWRSVQGEEVDFIVGDYLAIEVKATRQVTDKHLKSLSRLAEENICVRYILVSNDPIARHHNGIELLPWRDFLDRLWKDLLITSSGTA